eukprot:3701003-Amphidinium_carterae.1
MKKVKKFRISSNGFTGAVPKDGVRAMRAVTDFHLPANSFTGSLQQHPSSHPRKIPFFVLLQNFREIDERGFHVVLRIVGKISTARMFVKGVGKFRPRKTPKTPKK